MLGFFQIVVRKLIGSNKIVSFQNVILKQKSSMFYTPAKRGAFPFICYNKYPEKTKKQKQKTRNSVLYFSTCMQGTPVLDYSICRFLDFISTVSSESHFHKIRIQTIC